MKKLLCLTVVMLMSVNASASVWVGTDPIGGTTAGDGIWSNANNWATDDAIAETPTPTITQGTVPTSTDTAYLLGTWSDDDPWSWLTSIGPALIDPGFNPGPATINGSAQTGDLWVGYKRYGAELNVLPTGTLNVNGTYGQGFIANNCYLTNEGTMNVTGDMWVGWSTQSGISADNYGAITVGGNLNLAMGGVEPGVMTNHSGTLDVAGTIDMNLSAGFARLNVYGGTVTASGVIFDPWNQDTLDITEGTLILDGDVRSDLDYWIGGHMAITAYSGSGRVMYDYDITTPGKTTVWAVPPGPSPINGETYVSITTDLEWDAAPDAISYDVYFGDIQSDVANAQRLTGDINGDGPVNVSDLAVLAGQWLTNPGSTYPSADIVLSNRVDLEDFAKLAADWQVTPDAEFKGNQDVTAFDPGTLVNDTPYYWRIDEVNADGTTTGPVWNFTTISTSQKWFGYTYVYFDGWINDIPSVAGYTNMNHILVYPDSTTTGIQSAIAYNTKVLLDVKFLCFTEPVYHDFELRSDWQSQLDAFKAKYAQYKDAIVALTPMDEPYWHGVTKSEVDAVAAKLRADWPGIPIYLNLAKIGFENAPSYFEEMDWVSFDTFDTGFDYDEFVVLLGELKSTKTSSQKIILTVPNWDDGRQGTDAQQAQWNWDIYNNLMKDDDEVIGSLIWLGDSYRIATYEEGPLPQNKAALESIGHQITGK